MAFWSTKTSEPKRNYRFKVTMSRFAGSANDVMWWAKTAALPSFEVSEVEHNHMDNKYYFPGRVSWSTVAITLVDPISPDATDLLNRLLVDSGYSIPGDAATAISKPTISKNKATTGGDVIIEVLNAAGGVVEQWTLQNAFIQGVNYGSLDYSSDDLKEIELTLRYDWATCVADGNTSFSSTSTAAAGATTPTTTGTPSNGNGTP